MNDNDEIAVTMWRALEKADTPEAGGIVLAKLVATWLGGYRPLDRAAKWGEFQHTMRREMAAQASPTSATLPQRPITSGSALSSPLLTCAGSQIATNPGDQGSAAQHVRVHKLSLLLLGRLILQAATVRRPSGTAQGRSRCSMVFGALEPAADALAPPALRRARSSRLLPSKTTRPEQRPRDQRGIPKGASSRSAPDQLLHIELVVGCGVSERKASYQ